MNKKIGILLAAGLCLLHSEAFAMRCDVDFRAKRMVEETRWFGTVQRPEFKSGTVSGEGNTERACMNDALSGILDEGWEITYQRLQHVDREANDSRERDNGRNSDRDRNREERRDRIRGLH